MTSFVDLQIAVLNKDHDTIKSILSELDRRTESDMFQRAAAHFGFKSVEHHGRRFSMRAEIARVMGYKGESGLRMLCERHDLEAVKVGTFAQNVRMSFAETLGLHANDGKTVLVGWDVFLLAGMESTTDAAQTVKAYLLQMERAGRVAGAALDVAHSRLLRIQDAEKVSLIAFRLDRMKDTEFKKKVAAYLDDVLDGALDIRPQRDLFSISKD